MKLFIAFTALTLTALAPRAFAVEPSSLPTKPFVPTANYLSTNVAGWTVRVNKELLAEKASLGSDALHLLKSKLEEIKRTIPTNACAKLQQVTIWLGVDDGHAPC